MNSLPEEIEYIIYKYKHQLEYKHVIDELKKLRIECFFRIDLNFNNMVYCNHFNLFVKCIDINNICAPPKRILNTIKSNKKQILFYFYFFYYYKYIIINYEQN